MATHDHSSTMNDHHTWMPIAVYLSTGWSFALDHYPDLQLIAVLIAIITGVWHMTIRIRAERREKAVQRRLLRRLGADTAPDDLE